jgi:hypothetical protein
MSENIIENLLSNLLQDRNLRGYSSKWANWKSQLTIYTCKFCIEQHGKIVDISILDNKDEVQAHPNCKCIYVPMRTKTVGTATNMGYNGADAQIFYLNKLPDYYVSKKTAYAVGWKTKYKRLDDVLPGKMIGGDQYYNDDSKLPSAPGRVWYEADINYEGGKRNRQRILYSNDGLIFATYDHYQTFYEITK